MDDAIREIKPPFNPEAVVSEFAQLLQTYRLASVWGDRYAAEWTQSAFRKCGINYREADKAKSEIYTSVLPALNSRAVSLLDNDRLVNQFCSLERRVTRVGREVPPDRQIPDGVLIVDNVEKAYVRRVPEKDDGAIDEVARGGQVLALARGLVGLDRSAHQHQMIEGQRRIVTGFRRGLHAMQQSASLWNSCEKTIEGFERGVSRVLVSEHSMSFQQSNDCRRARIHIDRPLNRRHCPLPPCSRQRLQDLLLACSNLLDRHTETIRDILATPGEVEGVAGRRAQPELTIVGDLPLTS